MLMAAIPESIRSDVVARKCSQSAPALLFRLHTTYQPGSDSEKALILKIRNNRRLPRMPRLPSNPCVIGFVGIATTITSQVLADNEEAKFRTFMLRAMLKMNAQPTSTAVLEYHKHLLAECEALAVSKPGKKCFGMRVRGQRTVPQSELEV